MPAVSKTRRMEIEPLESVLIVLNRDYKETLGGHLDPEDIDQVSMATMEDELRRWIDDFLPKPSNEEAGEYVYTRPELRRKFVQLVREIGIPEEVFRRALAFQKKLSDAEEFRVRVEMVASMLEYGFGTGGTSTSFGAREAMYLFLIFLRSPLRSRLRKCALDTCGRYFLDLSGLGRCCSHLHAQRLYNRRSVLPRLKKERDAEKREKLERARRAFRKAKSVAAVAKRTGLSLTFLTRNINNGNLKVPRRKS